MKTALIVLLAIFSLTAAMVPRHKRAQDDEETSTTSTTYCDPETPCGWKIFAPVSKKVTQTIYNSNFCICKKDQSCEQDDNKSNPNAYVLTCKEVKS